MNPESQFVDSIVVPLTGATSGVPITCVCQRPPVDQPHEQVDLARPLACPPASDGLPLDDVPGPAGPDRLLSFS
jgi:hypothetical protein